MTKADWLRSEIEKLEGEMKDTEYAKTVSDDYILWCATYNQALTSIITRYKEELKELEK